MLKKSISSFISLIFPEVCIICGKSLVNQEKVICTHCNFHLPRTNSHINTIPSMEKTFWGRVEIENVFSYLFFSKGNSTQTILHNLKYKRRKDVGHFIGNEFGVELNQTERFKDIDLMVPLPIHKNKLKKRGYNQSVIFGQGISQVTGKELSSNIAIKEYENETQTKKSRIQRWENTKEVFKLLDSNSIKNKHILVVDDVITTGATTESFILELLKGNPKKISIATIAYTN